MIKDILASWKKNKIFWIVFFILFLAPFFWFSKNHYILGEDDTGLMYYNTYNTFQQSLSSWFSADHIARFEESAGHFLVFNILLLTLKKITFGVVNAQQLIYGLLISLSFAYIVKILELITEKKSITYILAGLFYSLSPYFIMVEYYYLMPSTFAILLAPAMTFHLLQAFHTKSLRPLLAGALWSFILSRVLRTPTFINFFGFLFIFALLYAVFTKKLTVLKSIKYFMFYCVFILSINAMMAIPTFYTFLENDSSSLKQTVENRNREDYLDGMIVYIQEEISLNRINYYLMNVFPEPISRLQDFRNYDFYSKYFDKTSLLMFFVTIGTFSGLIIAVRKKQRVALPLLILFLLTLAFLTVNLSQITEKLYYFLMYKTPLFNMNRIPSMKFHVPYIFFYSLLVGIALDNLYNKIQKKQKIIFISMILVAILSNSLIFITGKIFTAKISPSYTVRAMDFNKDYRKLSRDFRQYIKDDAQLLLFPLGYGFGSFIMGEDNSQFYRSTVSGFKSFTGYNMFGNLRVLGSVLDPSINEDAKSYYFDHKTETLLTLAEKLNIKYVLFTKNIEPLRQFGELMPEHTYESSDYTNPLDLTQPVYENKGYAIYKLKNYDSISHVLTKRKDTQLSFKKVSDFMYLVKINTKNRDTIIFNEGYSNNWRLYSISSEQFDCEEPKNYAQEFPNILECIHDNNNMKGNKRLISMKNLSQYNTHHALYNSFGNAWEIDTKGKDQYLLILYEGQKYYIIGSVLSGFIFFIYTFVYFWYGKKRT